MAASALGLALAAAALHALWNLLLARERDTAAVTAVALVVFVILLVRGVRRSGRGSTLAVVIAATIAGYTVVDRYGIRHANAAPYLLLVMAGPALAYPFFVGGRRIAAAARPVAAVIGVAAAATYLLVLLALRLASAPSVSAVRESSVVIAVVFARTFLRETVGPRRVAGAAVVAAGIALL